MSADLLHLLARANLAGGAAILLVLVGRPALRRAFGAEAAYRLWLLPPLAAVASLVPFPRGAAFMAPIVLQTPEAWAAAAPAAAPTVAPALAALAWALGAVVSFLLLILHQRRFVAGLGPLSPARLDGRTVMRATGPAAGPAVVGGLIVVPSDFEARFTADEQRAILAHEAQHIARGDVVANVLAALARCLCWFNPLVHLAAARVRLDQELACDAAVIAVRPALRRPYAEALLKSQLMVEAPPVGCAWPARGRHPLKQRIAMLKAPPPGRRRRATGAALLACLLVGGGYAAWAAQPGADRALIRPDWIQRPDGYDLVRFYPAEAMRLKQEGMATLECRVEVSGLLSGCKVLRQAPEGAGFGEATLNMAPLFRMRPLSRDGIPVAGGVVRIPVMFKLAAPQGT